MKKEKTLALAIKIEEGKTESKLKVNGINQFETIGLLVFQISTIIDGLKSKKQNI